MSSTLVVEPFTFASELPDADRAAMTDIWNGVWAEWLDGERPISVDAYVDVDRLTHAPEVVHRFLVRDGRGQVVGFGQAVWRDGEDGASFAKLFVSPDHRGAGVGRMLGSALANVARANGRTGMTVEAVEGGPLAVVLERSGFRPDMVVEQNRARVAEADDSLLSDWVARGEAAGDYSLVAYDAPCPDDLVAGFNEARHIMNDAPRFEGEPEAHFTVAEQRAAEESWIASHIDSWMLGVRHDPSGSIVGLSEMHLPINQPWIVYQGDTGVAPDHRGHGLGAWMKAVNHLRLRAERPDVELIQTWNASANAPMLRINRALGFRPVQTYRGWHLPFE